MATTITSNSDAARFREAAWAIVQAMRPEEIEACKRRRLTAAQQRELVAAFRLAVIHPEQRHLVCGAGGARVVKYLSDQELAVRTKNERSFGYSMRLTEDGTRVAAILILNGAQA